MASACGLSQGATTTSSRPRSWPPWSGWSSKHHLCHVRAAGHPSTSPQQAALAAHPAQSVRTARRCRSAACCGTRGSLQESRGGKGCPHPPHGCFHLSTDCEAPVDIWRPYMATTRTSGRSCFRCRAVSRVRTLHHVPPLQSCRRAHRACTTALTAAQCASPEHCLPSARFLETVAPCGSTAGGTHRGGGVGRCTACTAARHCE